MRPGEETVVHPSVGSGAKSWQQHHTCTLAGKGLRDNTNGKRSRKMCNVFTSYRTSVLTEGNIRLFIKGDPRNRHQWLPLRRETEGSRDS